MSFKQRLRQFVFPSLTRRTVMRIGIVAVSAVVVFGTILVPTRIRGISMEPTYHDGGFVFYWRQRYWLAAPKRGDIVVVRLARGEKHLLKRVVARAGQTVAFREGVLYVDGVAAVEPYVKGLCEWQLPERKVDPGHIYVVGDNRRVTLEAHVFGQISVKRVMGGPIW